jgi:hypothetical protein
MRRLLLVPYFYWLPYNQMNNNPVSQAAAML